MSRRILKSYRGGDPSCYPRGAPERAVPNATPATMRSRVDGLGREMPVVDAGAMVTLALLFRRSTTSLKMIFAP